MISIDNFSYVNLSSEEKKEIKFMKNLTFYDIFKRLDFSWGAGTPCNKKRVLPPNNRSWRLFYFSLQKDTGMILFIYFLLENK